MPCSKRFGSSADARIGARGAARRSEAAAERSERKSAGEASRRLEVTRNPPQWLSQPPLLAAPLRGRPPRRCPAGTRAFHGKQGRDQEPASPLERRRAGVCQPRVHRVPRSRAAHAQPHGAPGQVIRHHNRWNYCAECVRIGLCAASARAATGTVRQRHGRTRRSPTRRLSASPTTSTTTRRATTLPAEHLGAVPRRVGARAAEALLAAGANVGVGSPSRIIRRRGRRRKCRCRSTPSTRRGSRATPAGHTGCGTTRRTARSSPSTMRMLPIRSIEHARQKGRRGALRVHASVRRHLRRPRLDLGAAARRSSPRTRRPPTCCSASSTSRPASINR